MEAMEENVRPVTEIPASKVCSKCARDLPLSEYGVQRACPDGLKYECKACGKAYMAEWRAAHRPEMRAHEKKRRAKMTPEDKARYRAMDIARYHADPSIARDKYLRRTFGISLAEYSEMLKAQNGRCWICGTTEGDSSGRTLAVDHHHGTGAVRGLLCSNCNRGIGLFKDDPERLAKAISYLLEPT